MKELVHKFLPPELAVSILEPTGSCVLGEVLTQRKQSVVRGWGVLRGRGRMTVGAGEPVNVHEAMWLCVGKVWLTGGYIKYDRLLC